ncbi:Hypothetical protein NTJ_10405 [Nesidiocoris tenuis]|uniref:VWFC domain-containing protein n=1 Tax=Nesidiocoris tenuis TaxID=355587 RepID=A0ABN7B331_9HEMI|nr:Hypothetical protein NTJ_10405 [Nesidiocoris tenuis]
MCHNEGEPYPVDMPMDNRCNITCMCKNGYVECLLEQCPSTEGCHMLLDPPKGECCQKCKGCTYRGKEYDSGAEWRDPDDPCEVLTCKAGVVTVTKQQCYVPCRDSMPPAPGKCCRTCMGCRLNGQTVHPGTVVQSLDDPCTVCQCSNGRLSCSKKACPVLHCSPSSVHPPKPGECCPTCRGTRNLMIPSHVKCLLGANISANGQSFMADRCTSCECVNGTNVCHRPSCPVLDCPLEEREMPADGCCPRCPPRIKSSNHCVVNRITYKDGESWQVDNCRSCDCQGGLVKCMAEMCPNVNKPCPPNYKLVDIPGQCCPKCVESDGVCTVFGDPHYRTFDGKFYSFQGSCKYQLAADCFNNTFSIRVTNDARDTKISSWTKTVSIKIGLTKVNLGEKRRVKINGERVFPPLYRSDLTVTEAEDRNSVLVESKIVGIKVLWDGNSFLEVSVPAKYRGKLCGLCGNYNNVPRDDLKTRMGIVVMDPYKFGNSWRVGGKKACSRGTNFEFQSTSRCSRYIPKRGQRERLCRLLKSPQVFGACHQHLSYHMYYKSCLVDMCECPSKMCYCESLTASTSQLVLSLCLQELRKAEAFPNYKSQI